MKKRSILILCIFMSALLLMGNLSVMAEGSIGTIDMSAPGTEIQPYEAVSGMSAGTYYLNSEVTETFLRRSGTGFVLSVYYDSPAIRWIFESNSDGTFLIRSAIQNTYALYGSGTSVQLSLVPDTLTDNYKWKAYTGYNGGILLMNMSNSYYLYCDGSNITLAPKPSYTSSNYSNVVWRVPPQSSYVNLTSFSFTCGGNGVIGEEKTCVVTSTPLNATWRSNSNFSWSSSNTSVATVSDLGVITALTAGTATITAVHKSTGKSATLSLTVIELPIANGTYYISLGEQDRTLMKTNSNDVKLYHFTGKLVSTQSSGPINIWDVSHVGDGYYIICPHGFPGLALTYNSANSDVLVSSYTSGNTSQQWSFTNNGKGRYVIESRLSNGTSFLATTGPEGANTVGTPSTVVVDNNDEEWSFIPVLDASLIALPSDADRSSYFDDIATDLASMGYSNVYNNHSVRMYGLSRDELLCYMANSKITLIRTHGDTGSIVTDDINGVALTIEHLEYIDNPYLFEDSELILYVACLTGQGGVTGDNLVNATLASGAQNVIGFENVINTYAANEWSQKFFEKMNQYSSNSQKTLASICEEINFESSSAAYQDQYVYRDYYEYVYSEGAITVEVSIRKYVVVGNNEIPGQ